MIQILKETDRYRAGILPPEDWATYAPELLHYPWWPPDPNTTMIVVVEDRATQRIIASWIAANQVVLEGLYIAEEHRQAFTHVGSLLRDSMFAMLQQFGVSGALTLAQDPAILALARKGGFDPVPGTLLKVVFPPT